MKFLLLTSGAIAILIAGVLWWSDRTPLPGPALAQVGASINAETCAQCHPGVVSEFATAPHSTTLRPGNDPEMVELLAGHSVELEGRRFEFATIDDRLWFAADDVPYALPVDWIFGSGSHALTAVSMDRDLEGHPRLMQLHVSWFADGRLGQTPGSDNLAATPASLGIPHDAQETERCFGCHTSSLPVHEDRIDLDHLVANIDCSRCHPGAAEHAASDGELSLAVDWNQLSPLESINRCGECHRRADELTPEELTPAHTHLIRFAPVGLSLSPCFQASNDPQRGAGLPRFDCLSCHDPHAPTRTDAEFFNDRCRECHVENSEPFAHPDRLAPSCSAEPINSSCIACHMPKVETVPGLAFTDHWIRIRD